MNPHPLLRSSHSKNSNKKKSLLLEIQAMSSDKITSLPLSDQELLFEKLEAITIQGSDKRGRRIVRIIGKFFPARVLSAAGGEQALKGYLEKRIFPAIGGRPFTVVYVHTYVNRSDNFPGVSALRSIYEALPPAVRDGIQAVFFVHPGLQARLFFATFGRFLFSAGLYGKMRYVNRLEFLWEHVRRGEVEVPEFVHDHDDELERRPLMDYGLESDHHRTYEAPTMDTASSMYSLRCIS